MIPAAIAYRHAGPDTIAHAVGDYSDRAFCGQLTTGDSGRAWPAERDEWTEPHPRCPLCATLVYT